MKKGNVIVEKTFHFSLKILEYSELLRKQSRFEMAGQLFRSGTSIGANVREAQNAESKADFIHKMKLAAKEAEETEYWLLLCERSNIYPSIGSLGSELFEIKKIINSIIATTKRSVK